jgi:hypothetical protein
MSAVRLDQRLSLARSALLEIVCRCCLRFRRALALLLGPFHPKISKYFWAQHLWAGRGQIHGGGRAYTHQFATSSVG